MLTTEKETELRKLLGGDATLLQGLLDQVATTDKAAQDQGVAFKDVDLRALIRAELESLMSDQTEKAAPPEMIEEAATEEVEAKADGMEMEPEGDENMLTEGEIAAIANAAAQAVISAITPLLDIEAKMGNYLGEMKSLIGGMATTKDAALAEVKTEIEVVKAQVADLNGTQPRILAGGYRASTATATVTTDEKLKEAQPQADPRAQSFADWMKDLGLGAPSTPA